MINMQIFVCGFRKIPSFLEMMSYTFAFHLVMLGPTAFYKDYDDFITGRNLRLGKGSPLVRFLFVELAFLTFLAYLQLGILF